jgi:DNA primase large subunit
MLILKRDLAKYPFTLEAAEYVKQRGLIIDDLVSQDYAEIVNRAEQRIRESILNGRVEWREEADYNIEILSFPVSIILVMSMDNEFLNRRYSLAESKRADMLLKNEVNKEILMDIAKGTFNWNIRRISETIDQKYDFSLGIIDFLKNAPLFHDERWKLINHILVRGQVYLKTDELTRLIAEEVSNRIQERLNEKQQMKLPEQINERLKPLSQILEGKITRIKLEAMTEVNPTAYPPCIAQLYKSLLEGKQISHMGRFALTSFLLNVGMDVKEVIDRFTTTSDFNEQLTRYQVEHIAGKRGAGTKYTSPNCETLQTHDLCVGKDELCKKVKHPLIYYLRKQRQKA